MSAPSEKIKVLVVDDSAVSRDLLTHVLASEPCIEIVGHARDGEEAVAILDRKKPDVVRLSLSKAGPWAEKSMDLQNAPRKILKKVCAPHIVIRLCFWSVYAPKFGQLRAGWA